MKYKVTYEKSVHGIAEIKAAVRVLKKSTAMAINVINFEKKYLILLVKIF